MGVRKIGTMDAILDYNNGYFGAIDPFPLFKKDYEEVIIPLQLTVISLANQVVGLLTKLLAYENRINKRRDHVIHTVHTFLLGMIIIDAMNEGTIDKAMFSSK